jgi:response regulator RpfG family c-di-GMP phosphodiesterase
MTYKLLIVDDEQANLRLLERLFSSEYECFTASSGPAAIKVLKQHDVAIIITDQRMPGMSGIELLKATASLRPHMVRILLTGYTEVEALVETINCGLVYMYFTKPWNNDDLKLKINRARDHYENNKKRSSLMMANDRLSQTVRSLTLTVVQSLIEMSRAGNEDNYNRAFRVWQYATEIGRKLALSEDEINELATAALLHNLGSESSLAPRRHLVAEGDLSRTHAECELQLLKSIPELANVVDMIQMQGENFDGSGQPMGLWQDQIPLGSRIIRVAAEYDLMRRPNSSASMLHHEAMRFLSQRSGKQFDPAVVELMSQLSSDIDNRSSTNMEAEMIMAGLNGITATRQVHPARTSILTS